MAASMYYAVHKHDIKMRMYEDDEETAVIDVNNAIMRRKHKNAWLHAIA